MDFNAIKTCELRIFSGLFKTGNDNRNLIVTEFARSVVGLFSIRCVHFVVRDCQCTRCHWLRTSIEERGTGPTAVPELEKDFSALGVDGISHFTPTGNLGFGVNSWLGIEGRISLHHHRGLGNDQARRSSLGIVFRHELRRHMASFGTATREWRHEDAVGDFESAELKGLEECGVRHRISFCW